MQSTHELVVAGKNLALAATVEIIPPYLPKYISQFAVDIETKIVSSLVLFALVYTTHTM